MRIVLDSGETYHLHFWHHQRGQHRRPRFMTELVMHAGDCDIDRETGRCRIQGWHAETRCHTRLDVFHKESGRAVVLDRLLKHGSVTGREIFPRPVRAAIWEAYRAAGAKMPESQAAVRR